MGVLCELLYDYASISFVDVRVSPITERATIVSVHFSEGIQAQFDRPHDRIAAAVRLVNFLRHDLERDFRGMVYTPETCEAIKAKIRNMLAQYKIATPEFVTDIDIRFDNISGRLDISSPQLQTILQTWIDDCNKLKDVPRKDTYEGLPIPEPGIYFDQDRTKMIAVLGVGRREKYAQNNMVLYQDVDTEELVYVPLYEWHSHQKWVKFDG